LRFSEKNYSCRSVLKGARSLGCCRLEGDWRDDLAGDRRHQGDYDELRAFLKQNWQNVANKGWQDGRSQIILRGVNFHKLDGNGH
jgi:hypothetical protein